MKKYTRLLKYLAPMKGSMVLYTLFTILSVIFSILSISALAPFLNLIFYPEKRLVALPAHVNVTDLLGMVNYYLSIIINKYGSLTALVATCLLVIVAIFFKNFFLYLTYYIISPMRNAIVTKLRHDLFFKILDLPIGHFNEQRKGDIISRMTNDVNELESSVVSTMDGLVKDPINFLFILGTLIYISPLLSLFLLLFLPLTGLVIGRVGRSLKQQGNQAAVNAGNVMSIIEETLGGLRIIKGFNAEGVVSRAFTKINQELYNVKNKIERRRALASPLSEVMGVGVLCCILWVGGELVLTHKTSLNPGSFIAYIALFSQIINPAKSFSTSFYNMQKGVAAITRIEEILQTPLTVHNPTHPRQLNQFTTALEFKNGCFSYDQHRILNNINLIIPKGKTIALVGSSGAGKSTLADLIPRFHDVTTGELLIDGVNIKAYALESLRNKMGIVTQEPILFNDTIANNIALGMDNVPRENIITAAKIANAHNYIVAKENGYDTNIGDRGNKLSGGEKQRLSIARAVLKNPPILILDEATSSLDTESEKWVQDAIYNMMKNRTCIVIAHRLSTIRNADEIIVLQQGEIAERGTHDVLMQQNGIYNKLVTMQEVK